MKTFTTSVWNQAGSYAPPDLGAWKYGVTFIDSDEKLALGGDSRVEVINVTGGTSTRFAAVNGRAVELDWYESTQELAVGTDA